MDRGSEAGPPVTKTLPLCIMAPWALARASGMSSIATHLLLGRRYTSADARSCLQSEPPTARAVPLDNVTRANPTLSVFILATDSHVPESWLYICTPRPHSPFHDPPATNTEPSGSVVIAGRHLGTPIGSTCDHFPRNQTSADSRGSPLVPRPPAAIIWTPDSAASPWPCRGVIRFPVRVQIPVVGSNRCTITVTSFALTPSNSTPPAIMSEPLCSVAMPKLDRAGSGKRRPTCHSPVTESRRSMEVVPVPLMYPPATTTVPSFSDVTPCPVRVDVRFTPRCHHGADSCLQASAIRNTASKTTALA